MTCADTGDVSPVQGFCGLGIQEINILTKPFLNGLIIKEISSGEILCGNTQRFINRNVLIRDTSFNPACRNLSNLGDKVIFRDEPRFNCCLLYTSPSPRDATLSRMPSSA